MRISARDEYDGKGTLTLWSGSFASDYEGMATPFKEQYGNHTRLGYALSMYDGRTGRVYAPKRSARNYDKVDQIINVAINGVLRHEPQTRP
jgi:hypothetical protein